MKIGILGTRGIPNEYGGFEQFAEFFAVRMQERGHELTVYNSSLHPYKESQFKGVNIRVCNDPEDRYGSFGQFIYDRNCILDSRSQHFDILLLLGYTSSAVWMHLLPKNTKVVSNMDGLEWKRSKYSKPVQAFLRWSEKRAARKSDALIADSRAIQGYLRSKYGLDSNYTAYGAEVFSNPDSALLAQYGVEPNKYTLLIARPEPENNVHLICEAHVKSGIDLPLLIIGRFTNAYGQKLQAQYAGTNIRFIGPLYDLNVLNNLRYHAAIYFHGHSVGGTNPSLLEAMASSSLICAHDNPFNRAVLESDAFYFSSVEELSELLKQVPVKADHAHFITENIKKIEQYYSWDTITTQLETYFKEVLSK
ncbi:MAG: glycosyltransferase family 1 protein [Bacteroidetes bacterium]|nr:MAG: glycosyltransferase family 1 protein [Bacteroidota bacterium]